MLEWENRRGEGRHARMPDQAPPVSLIRDLSENLSLRVALRMLRPKLSSE